jgi:predicted  nucleic acid-binding Zn-ribbon protein
LLEELGRLIELQAIDSELLELQRTYASVMEQPRALRLEMEGAIQELELLQQEDQQARETRTQSERDLAEGEALIRTKRMRLNLVRNEKELQALEHEVEMLKERNQRLESETLALMEAAEQRTRRIGELSELSRRQRGELAALEKARAGEVETIKIAIARAQASRDQKSAAIDSDLLQRYAMIASRRGGLAVAAVRKGICQGCRMRLPPQFCNEIRRQTAIHFCTNCHRILYCDDSE